MASDQLEGYVPPEEDKLVYERRLGSMAERTPEIRQNMIDWKQRFDYALAVMSGSTPADWLDQLGAREFMGEAGTEGAMYAVPSIKRFPITAMRPGATAFPPGVTPFVGRPYEAAVPKEKFTVPEAANVNVNVKEGWREVPYEPKEIVPTRPEGEVHHFLFDTEGRPVASVSPSPASAGINRFGGGNSWFINFLDPASKGDSYKFVGQTYLLDDFRNAKNFAAEMVKGGDYAQVTKLGEFTADVVPLYKKYFDKEMNNMLAEQRRSRIKEVGKPEPEVKRIPITEGRDAELAKMVEASRAEDNKLIAASRLEDAKRVADLNAQEAAFRAADAERRRGLFSKVEGGKKEAPAGEGPELVTAAVIETPDGKRLRGYSHFDAMTKNWDEYIKHDAEKMKGSLFETSTGRLIDKDEALKLMDKTGQPRLGLSTKETGLMSEDVPSLIGQENEKVMRELGIDPNEPHPFKFSQFPEQTPLQRAENSKFYEFMTSLSSKIDPEKWKRFIEAQPLSENIEDRRLYDPTIQDEIGDLLKEKIKSEFMKMDEEDFRKMKPL